MTDLTQWKFVKRSVMRSKDIGDWDESKKEIICWAGLDELTATETLVHELVEMVLCNIAGIKDKELLKYDRAHGYAMTISDKIVKAAGENLIEHEKKIVDYVEKVKYEDR